MIKLEMYFSVDEQIDFLQKHGWIIEYETEEFLEPIHGSSFRNRVTHMTSASKDGKKFYLEFAFKNQMQKCLLDL